MTAEIDWEFTAQARLEEIQRLNAELASWQKTAQDENDRAQELEVRLEAAEQILRELVDSLIVARDTGDIFLTVRTPQALKTAQTYLAVPARGEARAPEGGSTPPAAIALRPYAKLKPADIAEGEPTDLNISEREAK